mmetsp:Transcript_42666/g.100007  ORF Transcript_42666/g.100007 Transcript_42666/m.100007 type:complete len:235 (-) Transcript_42666:1258-1962(-)
MHYSDPSGKYGRSADLGSKRLIRAVHADPMPGHEPWRERWRWALPDQGVQRWWMRGERVLHVLRRAKAMGENHHDGRRRLVCRRFFWHGDGGGRPLRSGDPISSNGVGRGQLRAHPPHFGRPPSTASLTLVAIQLWTVPRTRRGARGREQQAKLPVKVELVRELADHLCLQVWLGRGTSNTISTHRRRKEAGVSHVARAPVRPHSKRRRTARAALSHVCLSCGPQHRCLAAFST